MRFGNCADCGDYKYIEEDGKCPGCLPADTDPGQDMADQSETEAHSTPAQPTPTNGPVALRQDLLTEDIKALPNIWRVLADVFADPRIDIVDGCQRPSADDLDITATQVRLHRLGVDFSYADYSGSDTDKVRAALEDALDKAVEHYG